MAPPNFNTVQNYIKRRLDLVLVYGIIGLIIAIFVPLPTWLIDFLLVINILGMLVSGLATVLLAWQFLHSFSFTMLFLTGYAVVHTVMNVRSLRVLLDPSVKAYVG